MCDKNIIEVKKLNFSYGNRSVLNDITAKFVKGKIYGILGPNGSGKSTMLKNIARLLSSDKNAIYISGKALNEFKRKELSLKMAVMPQNTIIDFDFCVEDIVMMGRSPYLGRFDVETEKDMEIVNQAMEFTGVKSFKDRSIKEISGGEMQRVVLARAIAQQTEILLLDEPVSQLDIHHQLSIMETVTELAKKQDITVVTVLHDLNLAAQYCNELILLSEGEVYKTGTPKEVLTYQNIEAVYKIVCLVHKDPVTGKPHVFPVKAI